MLHGDAEFSRAASFARLASEGILRHVTPMDSLVYEKATELMEAEVGEDLVALDPDAGACFGFNSVARSVWRHLEQPRSFEQLTRSLLDEYDVGIERCAEELRDLLDDMVQKGLVRVRADSGRQSIAASGVAVARGQGPSIDNQ